ncbi:MAG: preprotein translocase subunit SecY [Planctomycetota bacterium]|nr:preprotein translocase subunit SecY [Planctomycetota bacterium]
MILDHVRNMYNIPELRRKIFITLGFLVIYRLGSHIAMPGLDQEAVKEFTKHIGGAAGGAMVMMAAIGGSAISQAAIFSLGIMPYISASIIFSLLAKVVPALEEISKEGASGQQKINTWTRYATVPLCLIQATFIVRYVANFKGGGIPLVVDPGFGFMLTGILALTAGALFLMWIGELITEYGIGNGISLLIMAGIVAQVPTISEMLLDLGGRGFGRQGSTKFIIILMLCGLFVVAVFGVVLMSQAQRRIPVQAAKHTRGRRVYGGNKSHLPLRLNMAGVMPVIFASSLLMFPVMIGSMFLRPDNNWLSDVFHPGGFWYTMFYLAMIYFFAYFWTSLMFQPTEMAHNMKEHGQFVPGIRPGRKTAEFLNFVMVRVTFVGAAFLALVAIFPQIIVLFLEKVVLGGEQIKDAEVMAAQFLGGTGILIVVGVVLDLAQKVESHLLMRHYSGFMKKGRIKGRVD